MSKLKSDIWKQLVEEAGVAELDAAASITVEQTETELRAAGFDVAAERAKAAAFLDALESGAVAAPAPPRVLSERRRPVLPWLAAAAAVTVAGGALYAAMSRAPAPPSPDPPRSRDPGEGQAAAVAPPPRSHGRRRLLAFRDARGLLSADLHRPSTVKRQVRRGALRREVHPHEVDERLGEVLVALPIVTDDGPHPES